jgi:hypothetical protein
MMFMRLCYIGPDGHYLSHFCIYVYFFEITTKKPVKENVTVIKNFMNSISVWSKLFCSDSVYNLNIIFLSLCGRYVRLGNA